MMFSYSVVLDIRTAEGASRVPPFWNASCAPVPGANNARAGLESSPVRRAHSRNGRKTHTRIRAINA